MEPINLKTFKSKGRAKTGLIPATIFLLLFLLGVIWLEYFAPKTAELSGLILLIFAIPWTFFIHLPPSSPASHITNDIIGIYIPVAINTIIIYFLGNFLGNSFRNIRSEEKSTTVISNDRTKRLWVSFNIFFWIIFVIYFFPFLQIISPLSNIFLGIYSLTSIVSKLGGIIILSYFGYALTLKKTYLLLGLLGLFSYLNIGLIIGYAILFQLKKKLPNNQTS